MTLREHLQNLSLSQQQTYDLADHIANILAAPLSALKTPDVDLSGAARKSLQISLDEVVAIMRENAPTKGDSE